MNDSSAAIRLKHFLEFTGLTNSQFADKCGIPRPTLSQLLSGRNKKLSDQVLRPIHLHFPDLSLVWLMFGEGEMLVGGDNTAKSADLSTPNGVDDTAPDKYNDSMFDTSGFSDDNDSAALSASNTSESVGNPSDRSAIHHESNGSWDGLGRMEANEEEEAVYRRIPPRGYHRERTDPLASPRKVRSIMVYYDDNTYETFYPGETLPGYI